MCPFPSLMAVGCSTPPSWIQFTMSSTVFLPIILLPARFETSLLATFASRLGVTFLSPVWDSWQIYDKPTKARMLDAEQPFLHLHSGVVLYAVPQPVPTPLSQTRSISDLQQNLALRAGSRDGRVSSSPEAFIPSSNGLPGCLTQRHLNGLGSLRSAQSKRLSLTLLTMISSWKRNPIDASGDS
jgi:hypothetical protein